MNDTLYRLILGFCLGILLGETIFLGACAAYGLWKLSLWLTEKITGGLDVIFNKITKW